MSRDIDAEIAEKVMGWTPWGRNAWLKPRHVPSADFPGTTYDEWDSKGPHPGLRPPDGSGVHYFCSCAENGGRTDPHVEIPPFSTDIAAAWMVVERMRELGWFFEVSAECDSQWVAYFDKERYASEAADTAPLAICRAALRARGEEPG